MGGCLRCRGRGEDERSGNSNLMRRRSRGMIRNILSGRLVRCGCTILTSEDDDRVDVVQ